MYRVKPSAVKTMPTVFWDRDGIIQTDFLEREKTVNGDHCASLFIDLHGAVKEERRGKLRKGVLLLQDNAPVHTSHVAKLAAAVSGYELSFHPAYLPDMALI